MKSTRTLRLRLRLIEGALLLLLATLTAGAVATRQLLLDANNHPTTDISLSGSHWTGTLDAARLPDGVPLLDGNAALTAPGGFSTSDGVNIDASGAGYFYTLDVEGAVSTHGGISLAWGSAQVDDGGNADFRTLYVGGGGIIDEQGDFFGRTVTTNYTLSTDSGNFYTDGSGNAFAQSLDVAGMVSVGGDMESAGRVAGSSLYIADATVADADGYLWTANQPYHDGTVTPTGFLTLKDANGSVFLVPAMPRP